MTFLTRIAQALTIHKVDYAIAGGFAVALHGAVRGTIDIESARPQDIEDIKALQELKK